MIINTGSRTDIPAFFSSWFYNRIRDGFVMVRNPFDPRRVIRYRLDPAVVDAIVFCTKNPEPMLPRIAELDAFNTFWSVTVTSYGTEIEPYVPPAERAVEALCALSEHVGFHSCGWRYDPVFISEKYSVDYHLKAFRRMAESLKGSTGQCVVSFIDLYKKTTRNFPEVRPVSYGDQKTLVSQMAEIAGENDMVLYLCCEDPSLEGPGVNAGGCLSRGVLERALGVTLDVPVLPRARKGCECLLNADIGAYNTCGHGCRYCYANYDRKLVAQNMKRHDPESPFLIGNSMPGDIVSDAQQQSWVSPQLDMFARMG